MLLLSAGKRYIVTFTQEVISDWLTGLMRFHSNHRYIHQSGTP